MKDMMAEIRSEKPTISFEVFPPKKEAVFESVKGKAEQIAALHPTFMSVTYGAGGGTSKFTIDIAEGIQKKYDVPAMAHLTCVSTPRAKIEEYMAEMQKRGLTHIMALRGDIPAEAPDKSEWGFAHASDLISYVKEAAPEMTIGAACYPECHPESVHVAEDIANLKTKCDAGADFLTSQMFFDNNVFFTFLFKAREAGHHAHHERETGHPGPGPFPCLHAPPFHGHRRPFRGGPGCHAEGGNCLRDGSDHRPLCQWNQPCPCLCHE